ncbi:ubiquitin carboxyl-terminal hydrolase 30 homolog isoform X2 [Zootermopsis nevadensis]|uniref:ubiquitinyl hydrolase 1 n=2 Tax=Zootermopsis nevadensis TaxID=136037 RepID=A0A067RGY8_ZOONE|nr:ubiquitin carboxyl-terminal hydrolase 30 homolog isoform X2 [Zootermopsis nevadensis]XP_021942209.1 ubiquitin carboxyl-terminal hydrolase 30 homolog isoform X2 [Zootermopsis nevadensis]XP_021942210.1 ubiquitin carboxyl-terminal hydrolase 30 homolog isoform X2 [Zootermopsis nevadensis]XP_021942212.1 ubiquitin carboxyl-terminal hydrolase 30 homolog isoform X2 [Zootermopsis nevadensis]XP_021942213.1 ubiquitin carboxyl-terminal hydrolase 30 homolog isoform X2 [Zootermopsis nevadensis]XP_0219422
MPETKRENVLLFATVSVILAVGAFIFWGPLFHQKRRGKVLGLVNLGYTCFLNTLLQALASCPVVLDWLSKHQNSANKKSFIAALQNTLQVLNGKEGSEDPYTPSKLIQSLHGHGWIISPGEQDAHELFLVIVTTLEEEVQQKLPKVCSLSAAVEDGLREIQQHGLQATLLSPKPSSWWQEAKLKGPLPFQGLFASQLQCMSCKYKSAVHYATFYSLSLVLPPRLSVLGTMDEFYTLQELIGHYVTSRVVNDVTCDGCGCRDTAQVKSLNFGKLPRCLCIHIARTIWEGEPLKRDDHIRFPEILVMDPYTYNYIQQTQLSNSKLQVGDQSCTNGLINSSSLTRKRFRHLYQLTAVVVHKGSLFYGHFITYRRGVGKYYNSWFYTSDAEVRETTLHEVMQASAYMLFYTKFTSSASHSVH